MMILKNIVTICLSCSNNILETFLLSSLVISMRILFYKTT